MRCYTCHTTDFADGEFVDVTTNPDSYPTGENVHCLSCAAKYEEAGVADYAVIPTPEQIAAADRLAGINLN